MVRFMPLVGLVFGHFKVMRGGIVNQFTKTSKSTILLFPLTLMPIHPAAGRWCQTI